MSEGGSGGTGGEAAAALGRFAGRMGRGSSPASGSMVIVDFFVLFWNIYMSVWLYG